MIASWFLTGVDPVVAAEPPSGASFDIWYYKTDEDGERVNDRQFSAQDLTQYVNRARCECGQDISTRVLLKRAMMGSYDNSVRVGTYVGSQCDQGQTGLNQQVEPCVKILSSSPSAYTQGINFAFEPIWLAGGVANGSPQELELATPAAECDFGEGEAGVWICIENGMQPDCQADEFQVSGTQNKNSAMGTPQGIKYDFQPPQVLPSSFEIDEGDGAIVISWDQAASAESNSGFRVLCADADGNPLPQHGVDNPPSLTAVSQGTIYWTKNNLCPGGEFADPGNDLPEDPSTDGGTLDGDSTGGSTTDAGTTGVDPSTTGSDSSGDSSGDSTGDSSGTGGEEFPATGIESLDWDYVCTGHLSGTARSARIEGLDNEREYQFLVVAYDAAGNPAKASDVLTATPRETIDLWEQCEIAGEVCGEGGFCSCTAAPRGADALGFFGLTGVGLLGWARRRRRG